MTAAVINTPVVSMATGIVQSHERSWLNLLVRSGGCERVNYVNSST
jgi:murein DD-endopeptidase MepM/ murein hydrolase activator NlpD